MSEIDEKIEILERRIRMIDDQEKNEIQGVERQAEQEVLKEEA